MGLQGLRGPGFTLCKVKAEIAFGHSTSLAAKTVSASSVVRSLTQMLYTVDRCLLGNFYSFRASSK